MFDEDIYWERRRLKEDRQERMVIANCEYCFEDIYADQNSYFDIYSGHMFCDYHCFKEYMSETEE